MLLRIFGCKFALAPLKRLPSRRGFVVGGEWRGVTAGGTTAPMSRGVVRVDRHKRATDLLVGVIAGKVLSTTSRRKHFGRVVVVGVLVAAAATTITTAIVARVARRVCV
jgi:hypothetical protein